MGFPSKRNELQGRCHLTGGGATHAGRHGGLNQRRNALGWILCESAAGASQLLFACTCMPFLQQTILLLLFLQQTCLPLLSLYARQCGTIIIRYEFRSGTQRVMPEPGNHYSGTARDAYLPDNDEGKEVCNMLKVRTAVPVRLIKTIALFSRHRTRTCRLHSSAGSCSELTLP